jgi:prophage regulatory protein
MQTQTDDLPMEVGNDFEAGTAGRLLRMRDVLKLVGMSRAWIYEAISRGAFPRPVQVGTRAVAWREEDIAKWKGGLQASTHK